MANYPFEVRLYESSNTRYRALPLSVTGRKGSIAHASWRITRTDGYADATLLLNGPSTAVSGLVAKRRVEFWGKDTTGNLIRLYRGYIAYIDDTRDNMKQCEITLYGIWQKRSKAVVRQRWAWPGSMDVASAWAQMANRWVRAKYSDISIYTLPIGQTVDSMDGWRRTLADLSASLIDLTGGFAVSGCDVDSSGNDRLFFRPFDSSTGNYAHTLPFPDPQKRVRRYGRQQDISKIINVSDLVGGVDRYPNLLGEATQGNNSFEIPIIANGAGTGNILDVFSLNAGASSKPNGGTYGNSETGGDMFLIDAVGENAQWTFPKSGFALTAGHQYTFWTRMRLANGGAIGSAARLRIYWKNNVGTVIQTDEFTFDNATITNPLNTAIWTTYTLVGVCPAGAVTGICEEYLTVDGGNGDGVVTGLASFYDSSVVVQQGWELYPRGTASVTYVDWAYESDKYHGAYSVLVNGVSSDVDDNDIALRALNGAPFSVQPNQSITLSVWVKSPPGATSIPKVQMQLFDFKSDGTYLGATKTDYAASGTPLTTWTQYSVTKTVGGTAAKAQASIVLRGSGSLLFDAVQVRDAAATVTDYRETQNFEQVLRSDVLYANATVQASITNWDELPDVDDQPQVQTYSDGNTYGTAKFKRTAVPIDRPPIELVGKVRDFWPGQYIRGVGSDAASVLPTPLPIMEVVGEWDGITHLKPVLQTEIESEIRDLRDIANQENKRTGGRSSSGSRAYNGAASGTGGGGSGGGSTGGLRIVQDEGVSIAQRTNLNFVGNNIAATDDSANDRVTVTVLGGVSGTITIPKLTTANGSITVVDGRITAFVNPT